MRNNHFNHLNTTFLLLGSTMFCSATPATQLPVLNGSTPQGVIINTGDQSMTIMSSKQNNVLKWKNFNISEDALVNFDNRNYLNIVTGGSHSLINGRLQGFGNIYLVNPAGFTLGASSSIQAPRVGLSSAKLSAQDLIAFEKNGTLDMISERGMGRINLIGNINTDNLVVDGGQIVIRNSANLKTLSGDSLHNRSSERIKLTSSTKRIDIGCDSNVDLEKDYGFSGKEYISHKGQQAISSKEELLNLRADGNYFITNDIDLGNISSSLAGGNTFTGTIDGTYSRINYQNLSTDGSFSGLFSGMSDAQINNLFLKTELKVPQKSDAQLGALATTIENSNLKNLQMDVTLLGKADVTFDFGTIAARMKGNNSIENVTGTLLIAEPDFKSNITTRTGLFCAVNEGNIETKGINGIAQKIVDEQSFKLPQISSNLAYLDFLSLQESFASASDEERNAFVITKQDGDFLNVSLTNFHDPFFTENFHLDYDERSPDYASLVSNDAFDLTNFVKVSTNKKDSTEGKFVFDLENNNTNSRGFYFINTAENGNISASSKGHAIVTTVIPKPTPSESTDHGNTEKNPSQGNTETKTDADVNTPTKADFSTYDYFTDSCNSSKVMRAKYLRDELAEDTQDGEFFGELYLKFPRLGSKMIAFVENATAELLASVRKNFGQLAKNPAKVETAQDETAHKELNT